MGRTLVICATAIIITVILAGSTCYIVDSLDRYTITDTRVGGHGHVVLDRKTGEVSRVAIFTIDDKGNQQVLNNPVPRHSARPNPFDLSGIPAAPVSK